MNYYFAETIRLITSIKLRRNCELQKKKFDIVMAINILQ